MAEALEGGQTTNTPLTPNSNALCAASGNPNDDTQIAFQYNNATTYWSPQVSSSFTTVQNGADVGNGVVTFTEGLTVQYLPQTGGTYTVIVTGTIIDSGSKYLIKGKSLGLYPIKGGKTA